MLMIHTESFISDGCEYANGGRDGRGEETDSRLELEYPRRRAEPLAILNYCEGFELCLTLLLQVYELNC